MNTTYDYTQFDFSHTTIELLLHETEDKKFIIDKLEQILLIPNDLLNIKKLEGHWGNEILLLSCILDKTLSQNLILKIFSSLTYLDKEKLIDNLGDYLDEKGYLYIRIDKQNICKNKISLDSYDSIKLVFKPTKKLVTKEQKKIIPLYYRRLLSS